MADTDEDAAQALAQKMKEPEVHIAGIIVCCARDQIEAIKARISMLPNAEFHAQSPDGKLVITLEADSTKHTLDCMDAIRALPGVFDISLVYQHAESAAAMEEELES